MASGEAGSYAFVYLNLRMAEAAPPHTSVGAAPEACAKAHSATNWPSAPLA